MNWKKYILYLPFRFLAMFQSKETMVKKYDENAKNIMERAQATLCSGHFGIWKNTFVNSEMFQDEILITLEDDEFKAPRDYDRLLSIDVW